MKSENEPFFIVGVHRSGTTLLRYMLSSHPRIYVPPESDFIPRFFQKQPSTPLDKGQARRILTEIFNSYRFAKEWRGEPPDPEGFIESLPDLKPSTFLNALYQEYASQFNAQRWGDKTPIYASYIDLIDEIFPGSKFIHIIRDGRDVALSMVETWGAKEFHIDPYFAAASWDKRIQQAQCSAQKLRQGQYYQLHYEALVANPEPVLKEICQFLGEEYYASMANPQVLGIQRIAPESFHAQVRQPPNTSSVGRWKRDLPLRDQRLVQKVACETLANLGYEPVQTGPMHTTEKVRFTFLKVKYHLLQYGRKLLQYTGVFHPN